LYKGDIIGFRVGLTIWEFFLLDFLLFAPILRISFVTFSFNKVILAVDFVEFEVAKELVLSVIAVMWMF
jgi:hypothetical protein